MLDEKRSDDLGGEGREDGDLEGDRDGDGGERGQAGGAAHVGDDWRAIDRRMRRLAARRAASRTDHEPAAASDRDHRLRPLQARLARRAGALGRAVTGRDRARAL
ncbi:MAG TPA: hypothetical protein VM261_01755 [Kofleriaceae bacterium]|nr:hypothetical protein [Kofleriaceae bacterium]